MISENKAAPITTMSLPAEMSMPTAAGSVRVCQCPTMALIEAKRSSILTIPKAESKSTESNRYMLYVIKFGTLETRRRYSEFESFRILLAKLYPAIFVPPIPGKHSLSDYAHAHTQSRQKEELAMVEKRKRMLQRFLRRLVDHPVLSQDHLVHQFLQPTVVWNDIITSSTYANLKNPLAESLSTSIPDEASSSATAIPTGKSSSLPSPSSTAGSATAAVTASAAAAASASSTFVSSLLGSSTANHMIPLPSLSFALRDPDPMYISSESLLDKQLLHANNRFDRSQKRVLRRLNDLSNDYADMGAAYNALSLDEVGVLANAIEQLGLSNDDTCVQMRRLITQLEIDFAEHVQEYVQYTAIARQSIRYWYIKQAQLEMIGDALVTKQTALQSLLKTEGQSEKLQATMKTNSSDGRHSETTKYKEDGTLDIDNEVSDKHDDNELEDEDYDIETHSIEDGFSAINASSTVSPSSSNGQLYGDDNRSDAQLYNNGYPSAASISAIRASKSRSKKWTSPRKLFNAMTYTLQGMIDVDPEQTRRNQIRTLREAISQLETARKKAVEELKYVGHTVQEELQRYEQQKATELKDMVISFARLHLEFCEKNMISWNRTRHMVRNMAISD